ncbi:hypothetical protein [Coraliomargarita sinensis]|nr:hypothetical protein [Coraliomargarita sinensis]
MKSLDAGHAEHKARNAKRVIVWVMLFLILLPFVLIWLTDAVSF